MDRNICEDGTIVTETNKCLVAWHKGIGNNNYGPDTAMNALYDGTKEWTNVPDILIDYTDENNIDSENRGYTSIITNKTTKVTTITGKNGATNTMIGTSSKPLKARLPEEREVYPKDNTLCTTTAPTCPMWLVEYLSTPSWCTSCLNKYMTLPKTKGIQGYWIMSSSPEPNSTSCARLVSQGGRIYDYYINYTDYGGIRPVITVNTYDLLN